MMIFPFLASQRNTFLFTFLVLLASCTVVKKYPENKPFVYANKINVKGNVDKNEIKRLQAELYNYWDDSLMIRSVLKYGVRTVIENPAIYDSSAISRSIVFMNSYLNSQGYYNAEITPAAVKIDTQENQLRTTVQMDIDVHKNLTIDSVTYDSIKNTQLRQIALDNQKNSSLKKNTPFTKSLISGELDRLTNLYRRSGYFRFTRENILALVDTGDISLLDVTLDPFEQAQRIAEAQERRKANPTIDVSIKDKLSADSNAFTRYHVGNIFFYPETLISQVPDSIIKQPFRHIDTARYFTLKQNNPKIKLRPLREHTYLRKDSLYNEQDYFKTVNALSQMGPWNQVEVRTMVRKDSLNFLDFHFFLTPAYKYSFGYDFEVSRNSGNILTGNLLGITNSVTLRNRNVGRQAIQSSTNVRAGVELGFSDTILQTTQASISQTFSIPRFITPFRIKRVKRLDDYKTVLTLNASYTDRRNFFRLRSAVASFGYEWRKNKHVWIYRPVNVELYTLDTLDGLKRAFVTNPFLRTAFNTGYVISQNITYSITFPGNRPTVINNLRLSAEEAGAIFGRLRGLRDKIYQYLKFEAEFRQVTSRRRTSFAYRFFGGIGYNYSNDPTIGQSLPFFKQFVGGGPYSMRAWGVRQIGLGSSLLSDTSIVFRDRFGDIQLETNVEYRFPITTIGGVKINSALFVDMGNLWNLKNSVSNPESKLSLNRFFRDIAIGAGTGVRFDFDYFLVRFDFGYKVKDPARRSNSGWMSIRDFEWRNKEFNVKDGNGRMLNRNNFAFQLGIGLPF